MDLHKISMADIKGMEQARLKELEGEVRKEVALSRMDITGSDPARGSKVRGFKKSLARIKTYQTSLLKK